MLKTRILCLILNSPHVLENQLYFMVKKSNFAALFHNTFYLCGITESLETKVVISGNGLLWWPRTAISNSLHNSRKFNFCNRLILTLLHILFL